MSLQSVRRAFDAAFLRMIQASQVEELEHELSNMLHHMYRVGEIKRSALGDDRYYRRLDSSDDLRLARAALWARTFDTHDAHVAGEISGLYSNYYTNLYGVLAWVPLSGLPPKARQDRHGRHRVYEERLANRPVLDTMRVAFDALCAVEP